MPRYYFDLHNDIDTVDEEGVELAGVDDAVGHALREARWMIQASVADTARIDLRHHIDVRDENGNVIYVMHFEDAVTVQRAGEVLSRASVLRSV